MTYSQEQIDELKLYCSKVSALTESNQTFFYLEDLALPEGCEPGKCNALLRPFAGADGYPSQLYFSVQVKSPYSRNWNVMNVRICEKNWFAFSWKVNPASPTLVRILLAHLSGFTKEK